MWCFSVSPWKFSSLTPEQNIMTKSCVVCLKKIKKKPIIKYLSHYPRPQSSTLHGPLAGFLPTQIFIALIIHTKFYFQQYCRVGSGFFCLQGEPEPNFLISTFKALYKSFWGWSPRDSKRQCCGARAPFFARSWKKEAAPAPALAPIYRNTYLFNLF